MVRFMRRWLVLLVHMVLVIPAIGQTEPAAFESPPASASFDDVDEATLQAEVTEQARDFLDRLQRHWGEGPERLRTVIAAPVEREEEDTLIFLRNHHDHGVLEGYEFQKGSLMRGQYVMVQRPLNGLNEFIGYYTSLKQAISATYGEPHLDSVIWDNDLYQPLPEYWGVAVMIGHLRYHATWETAEGTIALELTGSRHSRLSLDYRTRQERADT
jgi:hypothetical protein